MTPLFLLNRLRRFLYREDVLRARRLPKPVISVGNIAMGGTGKTPAVIAIAKHLAGRGYRVAILTRGYGRSGVGGKVESLDAAKYGDEPTLIKKSVENADVIVGANRYRNGMRYQEADLYILDDGFQHLQLHRDFDIVIDAPSRFYREGRDALQYADLVLPRRIRLQVPPDLRGKRVFAFSGLANNRQFFASLREEGLDLADTRGFPDHHRYTSEELDAIVREAGPHPIVTTEKDAMKISRRDIIPIPAEFVIDADVLDRIERVVRR